MCQQELAERRVSNMNQNEREESQMTDYQFRFIMRELLAYAKQAPDKETIVKHLEELLNDNKKA